MPSAKAKARTVRSEVEITAVARQVLLHRRLCPDAADEGTLYSQRTLYFTQGWPFEERRRVFSLAMWLDPLGTRHGKSDAPDDKRLEDGQRLRDILEEYGDDGRLSVHK